MADPKIVRNFFRGIGISSMSFKIEDSIRLTLKLRDMQL